jgi:hypothetical protein
VKYFYTLLFIAGGDEDTIDFLLHISGLQCECRKHEGKVGVPVAAKLGLADQSKVS